jgi:hypothetical protein
VFSIAAALHEKATAAISPIDMMRAHFITFEQLNPIAAIRFAFFFVQAACMIAMGVIAAVSAG